MGHFGDHIDNKFGGCDVPFDGKVLEVKSPEEQLALISATFTPFLKAIESLIPTITAVAKALAKIGERIMQEFPNKRVVHLALHGKKARTRKKNMNRIKKEFWR